MNQSGITPRAQSDCHALTIRKRPARRGLRGYWRSDRSSSRRKSVVIDNDNDIRDGDAHPAIRRPIVPRTTQSCLSVRERERECVRAPRYRLLWSTRNEACTGPWNSDGMISIIQMNIYIKLGPWTAILERISKPYQRYWKLYVVFPSPRGEEGSLLSRFSMNTPMRLFTRLARSLILQGGRAPGERNRNGTGWGGAIDVFQRGEHWKSSILRRSPSWVRFSLSLSLSS